MSWQSRGNSGAASYRFSQGSEVIPQSGGDGRSAGPASAGPARAALKGGATPFIGLDSAALKGGATGFVMGGVPYET